MCECCAALLKNLFTMCDEEYPVARQPFAKARVVDGRNDRLARARCGHEQVPVTPARAREFNLFKQSILKWHQDDLNRAQAERLFLLGKFSAGAELVPIEWNEITAR